MMDATGKALAYPSLWELLPGGTAVTNSTMVSGGSTSPVCFTSGLAGEKHGLLAQISNGAATTNTAPTFGFSAAGGTLAVSAGSSAFLNLSVAPVSGFTGNVSFTCSGLPAGATCRFAPSAALMVAATAAAQSAVTIDASGMHAENVRPAHFSDHTPKVALAFGLPMFSLALVGVRRRHGRFSLSLLSVSGFLLLDVVMTGCGNGGPMASAAAMPRGTAQVVITATSGSIMQQTTLAVTVQ